MSNATRPRRPLEHPEGERQLAMGIAAELIAAGFRIGITGIGYGEDDDSTTRRAIEVDWQNQPIVDVDVFERRFMGNPRARGVMIVHGIYAGLPGWGHVGAGLRRHPRAGVLPVRL